MINNNHQYTVIASLDKIYNHAKVYGKLKPKELYLLNMIYKLLNNCNSENCNDTNKNLISLYYKVLNSSELLCKQDNVKDYYFNNFNNFYIDPNNNTAPEIENPTPIEPETPEPPQICRINIDYDTRSDFIYLILSMFSKCYSGKTPIKYFKVISLPENGALQINDANAYINQIINLNSIDFENIFIKYQNFLNPGEQDSFQFQVSDSDIPEVYSETSTIIFNNI